MLNLSNQFKTAAVAATFCASTFAGSAVAQDKVVINMHTTVGSNVTILGSNAKVFADRGGGNHPA